MKSIKLLFKVLDFWNMYIVPLYTKLELIAMKELRKICFHSTFLVKFHEFWVRNFKSLNQLFLN